MKTIEFASFCRQEWPRLVGAMSLYTGSRDLAEDLAQETLARVWRDWSKVRGMDQPSAWAHRVAINLARSHWRREAGARRAYGRLMATNAAEHEPDAAIAVAVRDAVAALPARQRAALVLRYFADLSVRDTAAALHCPEGSVKTLTFAAIRTLRGVALVVDDPNQHATMRR